MRPRWPQDGLKLGQVELREAKVGISWRKMAKTSYKRTQDGAKMRKERGQEGPKWPQGSLRGPQGGPKRVQDGPKMPPKGAKMRPRWTSIAQDSRS